MNKTLDSCEGDIGITDNIIRCGNVGEEHDRRLDRFLGITREHELVLRESKCEERRNSVKFFWCLYDKHGTHSEPSKVNTIKKMLGPQIFSDIYLNQPHLHKQWQEMKLPTCNVRQPIL